MKEISIMHEQNYQDILALVQTPTRYTGNEINAIKKDVSGVDLTVALVFPDLYEIGTSHFGLQILYSILNRSKKIAAERFFAPAPDMEQLMRERQIPCLSMESHRPLNSFDIIGVSLLYELNFTNILTLFDLSGIPIYAAERLDTFPLIIGGGPCAFNPEPLADFFDAFVIGDGETAMVEISNAVMAFRQQGDGKKQTLLKLISQIEGVYIPSFFTPAAETGKEPYVRPIYEECQIVRRAILPELTRELFPQSPILPFAKPVHDRLRLEVARGCSRGCRFCQAGMIYRPVRERPVSELVEIAEKSLAATGYSDISLLSLSTGDYSDLPGLMTQLLGLAQGHCNSISLPSVRAEKLTPQLMEIIKKVRKTGFTIAPEAGSQRLRDIINKNLTEESIASTVENALKLGWKNIKLYFMLGLPFETDEDLSAICTLSTKLARSYAKGRQMINVSTTSFIPKAHTPFQRCSQISLEQTIEKLQYLKDHLRHPKIRLKWQDPKMSQIEGVWARGDRRLSKLLVAAFENGCRLDGWADYFNPDLWDAAFEQTGIDPEWYTTRKRTMDEALPWDHIDSGVSARFLKKEYEKAKERALTPDCREGDCSGCGICDFKQIRPVIHQAAEEPVVEKEVSGPVGQVLPDHAFQKFELTFSKMGQGRFFGHLEMDTIFKRAIKRTGFAVKYSKGFNPSMRLSFATALPVGMQSREEKAYIYLDRNLLPKLIMTKLNAQMPKGLEITGCEPFVKSKAEQSAVPVRYVIKMAGTVADLPEKIEQFLNLPSLIVEDTGKKGKKRQTDLRKSVEMIRVINVNTIEMVLKTVGQRTIRPPEILKSIFKMGDTDIRLAGITKME